MATTEELDHAIIVLPQDSSGDSEMNTSTPPSTPPLSTHNTSRSKYHMKDLSCFAAELENSAKRAFPNTGRSASRYKSAQVLLLRWEDDDMGVKYELEDLERVFKLYGFNTEIWLIPSNNSHLKLTIKVASFVEKYEHEDCLLIAYYGGHAAINNARQSTWYCKSNPQFTSVSLEWSAIQTVFEKAASDVVLLLDCCHAASAAPMAGRAITETIAACGWESITPLPGRWSFTNALIEVLEEWINHSFSVAMLHSQVLSTLKHERPERRGQKKRRVECRRTPVYILTTADPQTPSINLSMLKSPIVNARLQSPVSTHVELPPQIDNVDELPASTPTAYDITQLTSSSPTGDLKVPHVLVSLALNEDQELDAKACSTWLASFPALAKYASVKGVYKSYSSLILVSVPVLIWDLLPENPACLFIGYITSENLLNERKDKRSRPPQGESTGSGSSKSKKCDQVACPICLRFCGRLCELKKQTKRHDRPYGCTFAKCQKTFGSKNDWERHENSQHYQHETWRCDAETNGKPCGKVFYTADSAGIHLSELHKFEEPEVLEHKIAACRIDPNNQTQFWCGFCEKVIGLSQKNADAWTERFNHIDDHFMGRNNQPRQSILEWKPAEEDDQAAQNPLNRDEEKTSSDDSWLTSDDAAPVKLDQRKRKKVHSDAEDSRPPKMRSQEIFRERDIDIQLERNHVKNWRPPRHKKKRMTRESLKTTTPSKNEIIKNRIAKR